MPNFRFTHTRTTKSGEIIEHNVGTVSGYTKKSVRHAVVKRFRLQSWSPWRKIDRGFVKTANALDYCGKITLEEIL